MKRNINIQLILTLFFAMLILHSCSNEDEAVVRASKRLIMKCTFDGFNGSATRAAESEVNIANGARMYLDFDGLKTYATYEKATNTWSIDDWSDNASGTVTAYYLGRMPESSMYSPFQGSGSYENTNDALIITATLKPLPARIRFRGESGKTVKVSGLQEYTGFDNSTYQFTTSSATYVIEVQPDGYTSYLYATFASETELTIEYDGDTYTETFASNVLQPGKSGYIDLKAHEIKLIPEFSIEEYDEDEVLTIEQHEAVDLGLSVKWATCNVGASKPEEYGDYFAWGETEPYYTEGHSQDNPCSNWKSGKNTGYDYPSYKWCNGSSSTFTKYTFDDGDTSGIWYKDGEFVGDGLLELELADDAAHANWGGKWRMPTYYETQELKLYCTFVWTIKNGINGFKVTSKVNGNSIFLPAAGHRNYSGFYSEGTWGTYWTNCIDSSFKTYAAIEFNLFKDQEAWRGLGRCQGNSIRPVCSK